MEYEGTLFARAFVTGMVWLLFLLLLNGIRKYLLKSAIPGKICDLFFWLFTGILCFYEVFCYNQGILRGFLLLGCVCGAFLMNFLLKRLLFRIKRCKILVSEITESSFFEKKKRILRLKRSKRIEKVKKKKK